MNDISQVTCPPGFTQCFASHGQADQDQGPATGIVDEPAGCPACGADIKALWVTPGASGPVAPACPAALVLAALFLMHRLAESTPPGTELHARARRLRGALLSLALARLSPPLEVALAVEKDGLAHRVTATFPGQGGARVSVPLESLDYPARVRVAVAVSRPELADGPVFVTAGKCASPPDVF